MCLIYVALISCFSFFFFFNDTATTEIYTLSLHDALPISIGDAREQLNLEGRFPEATVAELARRGHAINRWEAWNELAGHAHGITLDAGSGVLVGGADPRSD